MATQAKDSVTDALPKTSEKILKRCSVCSVPVKEHVGKHGPMNCLGQAFVSAFQDLRDEMENIRRVMEEKKSEARDREVRLNNKVTELGKQLAQANLAIDGFTTKVSSLESELRAVTTTTTQNSADFGQSKTGGRKRRAEPRNAAD